MSFVAIFTSHFYCPMWLFLGHVGACRNLPGSIKVSRKLPTYPSPKSTLTLASHLGQDVGLGEGWLGGHFPNRASHKRKGWIWLGVFVALLENPISLGAHDPERATSMRSCRGVFTDQFIFRTVLARILNIFLNSKNQSAKPTDLKMIFFFLLITFSCPF